MKQWERNELYGLISSWNKTQQNCLQRMEKAKKRASELGIDYNEFSHYEAAKQEYETVQEAIKDAERRLENE